ncbi:hypothetical protein [Rhizobium sp. BK399]|uniref:hypothetical protein n=1 Tax=Rhizobium sp. BK399 TaxID=2587063 RepID=UPI00160E7D7E|nr:hypothetical protein [Rhizobium sp. BK399]MBB3540796.1 hypothetical protein [Rhizobium sp. BK399]
MPKAKPRTPPSMSARQAAPTPIQQDDAATRKLIRELEEDTEEYLDEARLRMRREVGQLLDAMADIRDLLRRVPPRTAEALERLAEELD